MLHYILIELAVFSALAVFVLLMCQVAKRLVWPSEPLHPSFVGSLLSASGTIFAASIAWAIADHNIEFQRGVAIEQGLQKAAADREHRQQSEKEIIGSLDQIKRHLSNVLEILVTPVPRESQGEPGIQQRLLVMTIPPIPETTALVRGSILLNDVAAAHTEVEEFVKLVRNQTARITEKTYSVLIKRFRDLLDRVKSEADAHQAKLAE